MKRTVNNVPLGSVLGLLPGFPPVVIENRTAVNIWNDNAPSSEVWEGLAKDIHNADDMIRYKWRASKVYEIRKMEKALLFVISTQYEEY